MKNKIFSMLVLLCLTTTGAWAAITTEDIGKVICTDGSLYATKILAQNDGKTAAAMIGYVDTENNKALAIALTDGNNNMDWTQACEYCTGLNTSLPVPNGTWVLPTEEQWKSVLTLEEVVPGYEVYKSESLNTKLNAAKGNALDNDGASYWSATELSSSNYVNCISFNYGMASFSTGRKAVTDGSMTRAFLEIELSGIEVTTNAASEGATFTEASFQMPAYDLTVDYELVRDMTQSMTVSVQDAQGKSSIRLKKTDNGKYQPADMTPQQMAGLITVTDDIEQQELTNNTDYTVSIFAVDDNDQPTGTAIAFADLTPGRYVAFATAKEGTIYDGRTLPSNVFKLFVGYEVEVEAGQYATFYKDENLKLNEDTENATLCTITSVEADKATVGSAISVAPALTPLLVHNTGNVKQTVLLIPTDDQADDVTAAAQFKGTLEGTTLAVASSTVTNYALNGTQFVWVKYQPLEVPANKCWLEVTNAAGVKAITLVDEDDATGIESIDHEPLTIDHWYDLNGRKVQTPKQRGIYINNGRKVVIK